LKFYNSVVLVRMKKLGPIFDFVTDICLIITE